MGKEKNERKRREREPLGEKWRRRVENPFFIQSSGCLGATTWPLGRPPA